MITYYTEDERHQLVSALRHVLNKLIAANEAKVPERKFICIMLSALRMKGLIAPHTELKLTQYIEDSLRPSNCVEAWARRTFAPDLTTCDYEVNNRQLIHDIRMCWMEKMIYDLENR